MRTLSVLMLALVLLPQRAAAEPAAPVDSAALAQHPAYRMLSARAGVSCDALPVATAAELAAFADPALQPPAVPMRAAHCLVQRFGAEAEAIVTPWLSDPNRAGQALVVAGALDAMPADAAARIASAALSGADEVGRARIARKLRASVHPQVAALGAE
jgi:hypothetical protein